MKLANGIIDFLINVITFYRDFFKKTYPAALIFALATVVTACLLLLNVSSAFSDELRKNGFILLVFRHTSFKGVYYIIDLYKICYLLFASFFAIGYIKVFYSNQFNFSAMISRIKGIDIFNIILAGIIAAGLDVAIYFASHGLSTKNALDEWLWYVLYEIRNYLPFLIFSIAVCYSIFGKKIQFKFKSIGIHFVCTWLFYMFSYNFCIAYKDLGATLILSPINFGDTKFIVELILTIPLLAFFIMGFTSVLTFPLGFYQMKMAGNQTEEEDDIDDIDDQEFESQI